MKRLTLLLAAVLLATAALAENFDLYAFESEEQEARFDRLIHELRCPKCQNQSLADSNAPIATDLRQRTYELVREGRSDDEVVEYLKDRYGEFITYRPSFNAVTALLWTGPLLVLAGAVAVLLWRRRRQSAVAEPAAPQARDVSQLLSRYGADGKDSGTDQGPR